MRIAASISLPHVYVFGAEHVGKALAQVLAMLPLRVHVIDTRPEVIAALVAVEIVIRPGPSSAPLDASRKARRPRQRAEAA